MLSGATREKLTHSHARKHCRIYPSDVTVKHCPPNSLEKTGTMIQRTMRAKRRVLSRATRLAHALLLGLLIAILCLIIATTWKRSDHTLELSAEVEFAKPSDLERADNLPRDAAARRAIAIALADGEVTRQIDDVSRRAPFARWRARSSRPTESSDWNVELLSEYLLPSFRCTVRVDRETIRAYDEDCRFRK